MSYAWLWLVALAFVAITGTIAVTGRGSRLSARSKFSIALVSLALLIVITATDWPAELLSDFWAGHSILTTVITTALLLGAGFLAIDAQAERRAQEVDDAVTAAGLGGLVEALADTDFAMTALVWDPEAVARERVPGKPLRWVRTWRVRIDEGEGPALLGDAPRSPATLAGQLSQWAPLAGDVLAECIRRIGGGLRDWSPLLTHTRTGRECLVRVGHVRLLLMDIQEPQAAIARGVSLDRAWDQIRAECRVLALAYEIAGGASEPRGYLRTEAADLCPGVREPTAGRLQSIPGSGAESRSRAAARRVALDATQPVTPMHEDPADGHGRRGSA